MKVQKIKQHDIGFTAVRSSEAVEAGGERAVSFNRTLSELSKEQYSLHMNELIGKIDAQAEKLKKRVDIREMQKYRQLIKEFLDEVVSNGFTFSRSNAFGTHGRHRFFATVKVIDEKLDELAKALLVEQEDNIDLLHRVDDIRGLLLDLMM